MSESWAFARTVPHGTEQLQQTEMKWGLLAGRGRAFRRSYYQGKATLPADPPLHAHPVFSRPNRKMASA
jgi:hypothetical protein